MWFSNGENIDSVASQGLAQWWSLADISQMGVWFYLEEHVLKIGVGVRIAICKIDIVLVIEKSVIPTEGEVWFEICATFAIAILVVLDIVASSMPA